MTIFAIAKTALGIPTFRAAFITSFTRGEAVQVFSSPPTHHGIDRGEGSRPKTAVLCKIPVRVLSIHKSCTGIPARA